MDKWYSIDSPMFKMTLRKSLISFSLLLPGICFAQSNFQKTYGWMGSERGHAIVTTLDGGLAIAGPTNSFGAGQRDIFILKVDSEGNILRQRTYGSTIDDAGNSIAMTETATGNLVVTGTINGTSPGRTNLFLFMVNSSGNVIWSSTYDSGPAGTSGDYGRGLVQMDNGDIVVVGTDDSNIFGSNEAVVIKTDNSGNLLWSKVFGGVSNDHLLDGVSLPGGDIIVCGSSQSFGPGNTAGYILRLDSDGIIKWAKTYGGSGIEYYHGCDIASDNSIVAVGSTTSYGSGQADILISKIDSSGTLLWTKTYGGSRNDRASSVNVLPNNVGLLIATYSESVSNGNMDIVILRTDMDGNLIWAKNFGTTGFEGLDQWAHGSLALTSDNGFAVTGWSDSLGVASDDIVLIKNDLAGSALCGNVQLNVASPNMATNTTVTGSASVGSYSDVNTIVNAALFEQKDVCYCIPDEACNSCTDLISTIQGSGVLTCAVDTIVLNNFGSSKDVNIYSIWKDIDGTILSHSDSLMVFEQGTYFLHTVDTFRMCERIDSLTVLSQMEPPLANAGPDTVLTCTRTTVEIQGSTEHLGGVIFSWYGPSDGILTNPLANSIVAGLPGVYTLTVVDSATGCLSMDSMQIFENVGSPFAEAGMSGMLKCEYDSVILNSSQSSMGTEYVHTWTGPAIDEVESQYLSVGLPGLYILTVQNTTNGCTAIDSIVVVAFDYLNGANFEIIDAQCTEDSSGQIIISEIIGGSGPYSIFLNNSSVGSSWVENNLLPGMYLMSITDSIGCSWDTMIIIGQATPISIYAGPDIVIHTGESAELLAHVQSSLLFDSIVWSSLNPLSCYTCLHTEFLGVTQGEFEVLVTAFDELCSASDTVLITVIDDIILFIPNAFSPNNDNVNDFINVFANNKDVLVDEFLVFDRWGEIVFRAYEVPVNTPERGWNGFFKGRLMDPGVFVYLAKVRTPDGSTRTIAGDFTLIR